jgi:hypothetical protein
MLMVLKKQSESKEPKHIEHEQSSACVESRRCLDRKNEQSDLTMYHNSTAVAIDKRVAAATSIEA